MNRRGYLIAMVALLWGVWSSAQAHQTSLSYLSVTKEGSAVRVTLALAFRDLEGSTGLDSDFDGAITWGEAKARLDTVDAYVATRLSVQSGGPCALKATEQSPEYRDGEGFLKLTFEGTCPAADQALVLRDTMFFDIDPTHRVLVHATMEGRETSQVLTIDQPALTLDTAGGGALYTLGYFIVEGIDHLLSGPDHLLFLFVLILPAIFQTSGGRHAAVLGVVLAVTGFTLGHALTLTAATTGYLRPPQRIVEIVIALSVLVTAIDNVWPFIRSPRSTVAFAFGLIHGFGFASALGALDLSGTMLAIGLVGFNIGIELAQIGLVLAIFPILYAIRAPAERLKLLPVGGSLAVAAIALWWVVRRAIA